MDDVEEEDLFGLQKRIMICCRSCWRMEHKRAIEDDFILELVSS